MPRREANRREPSPTRRQRGAAAELLAANYLCAQGAVVLARNVRSRVGELDLIVNDGGVLAIVEVRHRQGPRHDFGGALASVTINKQRRIIRAARVQLLRRPDWRRRVLRFDVVALDGQANGAQRIAWIKDAFRA